MSMQKVCKSCTVCFGVLDDSAVKPTLVGGDITSDVLIVGSFSDFQAFAKSPSYFFAKMLSITDMCSVALTFGARCEFDFDELVNVDEVVVACSTYTRYLLPAFQIFIFTEDVWKAFEFTQPFDVKKCISMPFGSVIFADSIENWLYSDAMDYAMLIKKAKASNPSKKLRKDLLK